MPKLKTTIEYLLYLLVFLLPWQTRLILRPGFFEYETLSLYGTDIILIFVLLLFIVSKYSINNTQYSVNTQIPNTKYLIPDTKHWITIALLELSILLPIFHSPDKLAAIQKYIHFLLGVGLFWLVTKAEYSRLKLLYAFLAGAFLQAALAIWQFFAQSAFAWKWLGLAGHTPFDLGHSVIETMSGTSASLSAGRWLRAYGGLDHPNILGGYLAISFLLFFIIGISREKKEKLEIGNWKLHFFSFNFQFLISNFLSKFFYIFVLMVIISGLFFSFSRSAWLSLLIGGLSAIFFGFWKIRIKKRESGIRNQAGVENQESEIKKQGLIPYSLFLIPLFLFLILGIAYKDLVITRLSGDGRLETKSTVERVASLTGAREIIEDNWLFGVGAGNYAQHLREINPGLNPWEYQPVHNVFLLVLAELGIFGFIIFLYLILDTLYSILKGLILKTKSDREALLVKLALLSALLVLLSLDHWLWSFHFGQLLLWLVLGVVKNRSVRRSQPHSIASTQDRPDPLLARRGDYQ